MKTFLVFLTLGIVLVAMVAHVVVPQYMPKPISDIRYRNSHFSVESVSSIDKKVFDRFGATDTGGGFHSTDISFAYGSRYNEAAKTYYYIFDNKSTTALCVRSENIAVLTGRSTLYLSAGETKFFMLKDNVAPGKREAAVDLFAECGWARWQGGGMTLALPRAK